MRTGKDYVAGLRDGRGVYLDGELVDDVTRHPGFASQIERISSVYDAAADEAAGDDFTFVDPDSGERSSCMWMVPRSSEDIARRRRTHTMWAEPTYGLMGRTPDHVASFLVAFVGALDVFEASGAGFPDNVTRFYEKARSEDLYVAYAIVPPQIDRSKPAHQQPESFLHAGVVEERDDGIVLRGALMIGTAAVMADYLFLSCITPLGPGDEDYAFSVVVPCGAAGLRIYPRRPYADTATSVFDYPLSSRLDETDSVIVLDDVLVPWEDVFAYRDVDLVGAQFFETGAHVMGNFQSLVRFVVKLHFATGLAHKLTEANGTAAVPAVQAILGGQVAVFDAAIEAMVLAAESESRLREGMAVPHHAYVYGGMSLQRRMVADFMRHLRELAGGGFIALPSSERSLLSPETEADSRRYYQGADASAEERVKFLRLLWDFVGTEFAGRQLQYEMFYSAPQHVVDMRVFETFEWERGAHLVEACLSEYTLGSS